MPLYNPAPVVPDWSTAFGVYGATPVPRSTGYTNTSGVANSKTLGSYTANQQTNAYTGNLLDLTQALRLTDGNALRTAVENLRLLTEAMAAQHNMLVSDLKATGLIG